MNYVVDDSKSVFVTSKSPKINTPISKRAKEVNNFFENHRLIVSSKGGKDIKIKTIKK